MTTRYHCYGLRIDSALPLPEMTPHPDDTAAADVVIRLGRLAPLGDAEARNLGHGLWIGERLLRLDIGDAASYEIRDGRDIVVDPIPGVDQASLRLYLLGSAFGALLMQRGLLVLHGNSIRIGDRCMVCVGHSGAGKSTLAATFQQLGHEILADDVVPVTADGLALPGFPRIKLWQDAADTLAIATRDLARIHPEMDKYNYPVRAGEEALPVRWVYWLDWHDGPDLVLQPLQGLARFEPLLENTYRLYFIDGQPAKAAHMQQCANLAGRIHLVRVLRPADKSMSAAETARRLLDDMQTRP